MNTGSILKQTVLAVTVIHTVFLSTKYHVTVTKIQSWRDFKFAVLVLCDCEFEKFINFWKYFVQQLLLAFWMVALPPPPLKNL